MPRTGAEPAAASGRRGVWLALVVALLALAGAGLAAWQSRLSEAALREQTLAQTTQRALQLADAMAAQVDLLLSSLDLVLLQLRREWQADPRDFPSRAKDLLAALPQGAVSHVTVIGADGRSLYNSLDPSEHILVGDREHFLVHRGGIDHLHVGSPIMSRLAGQWTIIVNRPLLRDGQFDGTLNLSVSSRYVAQRLGTLALSPEDTVTLVHGDGRVLARSREPDRSAGVQLPADRPFLTDRNAQQGIFRVPGKIDGITRLYGWNRVTGYDLVVAVGLAESRALAPMEASQARYRQLLVALLALILLAGLLVSGLLWQSARRQQALARSDRRYRLLLESAPDAIFVERDGRFDYLNPAALRLFGADDPAQLMGRAVAECWPDEAAAGVGATEDGPPGAPQLAQFVRLDGRFAEGEVTTAATGDEHAPGRQVTVRDVSERRRAERALQRLNDELEQRVEARTAEMAQARDEAQRASLAKSEFLSRMSHELRTPLNAILGFGQLLEMQLQGQSGAGRVREIMTAGRHLLALINDVLDLAGIESGRIEVALSPQPLLPLARQALALVAPQAMGRRLRLSGPTLAAAAAGRQPWVRAEGRRLQQVLLNLLGNAVKYVPENGSIGVTIEPDGDAWRLWVVDDGPGLNPEQQARLFTAFDRLGAEAGPVEGTGIGLALSARLMALMHGQIGVESTPGRGCRFWIRLPGVEAPADAAGEPPDEAVGEAQGVEVLAIEDNPVNLALIQAMVAQRPHIRLASAESPAEGLALARRRQPALILLDLHLPGMSGFEVFEQLRQHPATQGIPVVAVTASAMPADRARAEAAGFADYVTKPVDLGRLLAVLDCYARPD